MFFLLTRTPYFLYYGTTAAVAVLFYVVSILLFFVFCFFFLHLCVATAVARLGLTCCGLTLQGFHYIPGIVRGGGEDKQAPTTTTTKTKHEKENMVTQNKTNKQKLPKRPKDQSRSYTDYYLEM